jgi:hypothetical protein
MAATRAGELCGDRLAGYLGALRRLYEARDGRASLDHELEHLQHRIAPLDSDEWNLLYRLRLQVERAAAVKSEAAVKSGAAAGSGAAVNG